MGAFAELLRLPTVLTPLLLLLAAWAASTFLWYAAVGLILLLNPRPRPRAGPPSTDLGPEPPAVANLLVNDFRLTAEAAPATLLDLAARRLVEIEEPEPGCFTCRLRPTETGQLRPYEQRVLQLVQVRAVDGLVPAGALTTGPAHQADRWSKAFEGEVLQDCHRLGLCRNYWGRITSTVLVLWMLANLGLAYLFLKAEAKGGAQEPSVWLAFGLVGLAALGAGVVCRKTILSGRQAGTAAGLAAASRWLGVRDYLKGDEVFPTLPPASVTVWDRYLGHGAALGAAAAAVRALPMCADDDYRAWSSWGGQWRQVRVAYPGRLPLAWGRHPLVAFSAALIPALFGGAGYFAVITWGPYLSASLDGTLADAVEWAEVGAASISAAVALVGLWVLGKAIPDLWQRRQVTGLVLRLRRKEIRRDEDSVEYICYVAVDDGSADRILAWRVRDELVAPLFQYWAVTATVTPRLRYVREMTPVPVASTAPQSVSQVAG
jgi:hypothetical protein